LYWKEDWGWEMSTERQQTEDTRNYKVTGVYTRSGSYGRRQEVTMSKQK